MDGKEVSGNIPQYLSEGETIGQNGRTFVHIKELQCRAGYSSVRARKSVTIKEKMLEFGKVG